MEKYFTVGEAARAVGTTAETLRHYDRIGLVKPGRVDTWTGYRYYTRQDIVQLSTVRALQQMDLPLARIREVLQYDDLEKLIAFLAEAEEKVDGKIAALQYNKEKIRQVRQDYERKLHGRTLGPGCHVEVFPTRHLLLSDTLSTPTLENLWNYLAHFYAMVPDREQYQFEDLAGVYWTEGRPRLFAQCIRWPEEAGLTVLPGGRYLCAEAREEDREATRQRLLALAGGTPGFLVEQIILTGILQWKYQVQVYLGEE